MKRSLFHSSVLIHHIFVGHFSLHMVDFSNVEEKAVLDLDKYRWRFFTGWNFNMQIFYFTVCIIEDLLALSNNALIESIKKPLRSFKSFIFTAFVFPSALFVSTMFWSIYAINRELVFPSAAEVIFPSWLNHGIHTNITVVIMLEMLMSYHWYHKRKMAMILMNVYVFIYSLCMLYTYIFDGDWIYPMFHGMNWSQRVLFFAVTHLLGIVFYMIGEALNSFIWGEKIRQKLRKKGEKLLERSKLE